MTTEGESAAPSAASAYCIALSDVESAAERIVGLASRTPVLTSTSIDLLCSSVGRSADESSSSNPLAVAPTSPAKGQQQKQPQRSIFFKVEALQRTGSFKFRGALNATLALRERVLKQEAATAAAEGAAPECKDINVVTHSSGNHAQAVALAARIASDLDNQEKKKVNATICMPRNAPTVKRNAVAGFGGEIIMVDNTNEAREEMADRIVEEREAHFIHPSEDPKVIAGQGTAALEMVEQVQYILRERASIKGNASSTTPPPSFDKPLDAVIIPVGGGGLASGNTIALRGLFGDKVKIILAEPKELDDAKRSREAGKLLGHHEDNRLNSVADGLKTTLGPNTWPIVRDLVDDIITVSEEDILRATKLIWERLKVCIEPSAGVGAGVALSDEFAQKYRIEDGIVNVGVILCGGNVDIIQTCKLMEQMGL